ncbi:ABC transporter ATP-binding protein [Marinobacter xestospongiae]|uniref:ABC transporter ATP-binding protein n=1 Tax=Marinobacter xestospongiae TaxID=994319 RepID=A0ABU3VW74_9GAMM|nr:ABC transporter ATP-binding protein [Marinobacter xestospongiae]MDV2078532.1 ABC transporter ATP-binding protein [Marinobacter xestospongiae]
MTKVQFLLAHSGASQRQFWLGIVGRMGADLVPMVPWLMLFGYVLSGHTLSGPALVAVAAVALAAQWWLGLTARQSFTGAYQLSHNLRRQLLLDIRRQPLAALTGKGLGERIRLMTSDLKQFEDILSHLVAEAAGAVVVPLAMAIVVWLVSPALGALLTASLMVNLMLLPVLERRFMAAAATSHRHGIEGANELLEFIEGLPTLKAFGRTERLAAPLQQRLCQIRDAGLDLEWAAGTGVMLVTCLLELTLPLVMVVGGVLLAGDALTPEAWLVVAAATVACIRPLASLTIFAALIRFFLSATARLHGLATAPRQPQQGQAPQGTDLALEGVTLSLDGQPVLRDINLTVEAGEHLALVGPSGAGKSSLLHVIAGFHAIDHGEVRLGGLTLARLGTDQLYRNLSYVTQDVQLFAGSLRDNLMIANPQASASALAQAVADAGLDEVVARLPEGLDGMLGENGQTLSGGERQRVSIARALLRDAPVVLLDEVTSALDQRRQEAVLRAIRRLCEGKTVITVAHRLDTIVDVDRICVLEQGRLVQQGRHTDLLADSATYQALWQAAD